MIEYVSPHARSAYERLMSSCRDLDVARSRAGDTDLTAQPGIRRVTGELLARLAASPRASSALVRYADRVFSGECSWDRIEIDAHPIPPEVDELKADPRIDWPDEWSRQSIEFEAQPYRIAWE